MATYPVTTPAEQFKSRVQQRQARIGIIGLGYVGLPLALLYSEEKFASSVLARITSIHIVF